jgi:hypothetical protein
MEEEKLLDTDRPSHGRTWQQLLARVAGRARFFQT